MRRYGDRSKVGDKGRLKFLFADMLSAPAVDVVMLDLGWCGGFTESRKIAALAEVCQRPVAPHDCNGPVVWVASIHFMMHIPNALIMETVRAYTSGWFRDVLTDLPQIRGGHIHPLNGPGLGIRLLPGFTQRDGVRVRQSKIE